MSEATAILLAAGLSRRMGAKNKLLLPIGGTPMVRHVALTYLAAIDGPLTVVTGFKADRIAAALQGLDVKLAHNGAFDSGQPSSIAAGLAVVPDADLLLIGLADQPLLSAADITALIEFHRNADLARITIPMEGERRGNPIVVPQTLRARLTENPDRPGCMSFTRQYPEYVQRAPMNAAGFYDDIDTPEEFRALVASETEATY